MARLALHGNGWRVYSHLRAIRYRVVRQAQIVRDGLHPRVAHTNSPAEALAFREFTKSRHSWRQTAPDHPTGDYGEDLISRVTN
jgi:hypothetical protein